MSLPPNRVQEPDAAQVTPRQQALINRLIAKRGKVLIPYKIWLHAPGVAEGMEAIGTHLNKASSLTDAERELVVLVAVVHWQSPFPIRGHSKHARAAGLPEPVIAALLAGDPAQIDDPRLSAIYDLARNALAGADTDQPAFDRYAALITREGIAEVMALIGYFTSVALAMRLHDVRPAD